MANRRLDAAELVVANAILSDVRQRLETAGGEDAALLFALRRKVAKELGYDERSKPMQRRALKLAKRAVQGGVCASCETTLPEPYAVLDRLTAIGGYTMVNTRLICRPCDERTQRERAYK